jgi:hypothetical protein
LAGFLRNALNDSNDSVVKSARAVTVNVPDLYDPKLVKLTVPVWDPVKSGELAVS